ncbi:MULTISPECIES: hypothetical protein [Idiomarinaceae]|uniref:Uncharacterized protein n=4 Tax=Pseudidiomarina TaxID=2800384 RepID=A0A368V1W8_9GAMM|nr:MULTISPECIES: hypothetical protein [Idiomarinaceae]MDT7524941.1 hypothetical protein [Pseudidiomarina sp. GXY010]MDX1525075.1 hypothetical protein [Pseudidiomarina maritima]MRJ40856.1 hypothetical protein [Idiomarina sp. FeN1]NCU56660.1 hypothetical protein [Idiomarina sp. FenA--70]NCU59040.1 hypothetical protein [Idiomarina sp. FenBw--71]
MYNEFDIYAYLVSQQDMQFFEGDEETATDQLNEMLHYIVDFSEETDTLAQLEEVVRRVLFEWIENPALLELDSEEMQAYITEQLADVRQQDIDEDDPY